MITSQAFAVRLWQTPDHHFSNGAISKTLDIKNHDLEVDKQGRIRLSMKAVIEDD